MDFLHNPIVMGLYYVAPNPSWREYGFRQPGKAQKPWGKRQKCVSSEPGGGLTNGMPWDGTSPISEATVIDAPRPLPVQRAAPDTPVWGWDLCRLWEMADNRFFKLSWLDLARQLESMSDAVSDPEFAQDLKVLGNVAYLRHLNL